MGLQIQVTMIVFFYVRDVSVMCLLALMTGTERTTRSLQVLTWIIDINAEEPVTAQGVLD